MIDREKVIEGLECCTRGDACISACPYFKEVPMTDGRCITTLQADALSLLKEQEAVKPEWSNGKAFCRECGQPFPRHRGSLRRFCSYCGKAVKWE